MPKLYQHRCTAPHFCACAAAHHEHARAAGASALRASRVSSFMLGPHMTATLHLFPYQPAAGICPAASRPLPARACGVNGAGRTGGDIPSRRWCRLPVNLHQHTCPTYTDASTYPWRVLYLALTGRFGRDTCQTWACLRIWRAPLSATAIPIRVYFLSKGAPASTPASWWFGDL